MGAVPVRWRCARRRWPIRQQPDWQNDPAPAPPPNAPAVYRCVLLASGYVETSSVTAEVIDGRTLLAGWSIQLVMVQYTLATATPCGVLTASHGRLYANLQPSTCERRQKRIRGLEDTCVRVIRVASRSGACWTLQLRVGSVPTTSSVFPRTVTFRVIITSS